MASTTMQGLDQQPIPWQGSHRRRMTTGTLEDRVSSKALTLVVC